MFDQLNIIVSDLLKKWMCVINAHRADIFFIHI